jgi:hypothetical protein
MKVLDLQCEHEHIFEGWFGSEDDFQSQLSRGLVTCPLCGSLHIQKKLSAPRLNLGASAPTPASSEMASAPATSLPTTPTDVTQLSPQQLQAAWIKAVKEVMAQTEDVGDRFAEEARKIHYGEAESRGIRGQASAEQTQSLQEEGIPVVPLPIPSALKGPLQ